MNKISIIGDIICDREMLKGAKEGKTYNFIKMVTPLKDYFKDSDYVISNLETSITNSRFTNSTFSFSNPEELLKMLNYIGVNAVSLANNHILDRGINGIKETIKYLEKYNIKYFGISSISNKNSTLDIDLEDIKSKMAQFFDCKNEVYGFCLNEEVEDGKLRFEYRSCKYKNKEIKDNKENENVYLFDIPKEIKNAKMKDIYLDDLNRKEVITWLSKFIKNYDKNKKNKGLYLSGNFGCGKTYMVAAAFNELSKKNIKSAIVYWPEFLRDLKSSFDDDFKEKFEYIKRVPLLLIDDIGAEFVTTWSRDEILGTILQYRMEEGLTTFFTSNLNYNELQTALSITKGNIDNLKATRIMERIKNLTLEINIVGENRRK